MGRAAGLFLTVALWSVSAVGQSAQTQATGSAAQQTSVSANKSGAQVASATNVEAGTTVAAELSKALDARKNKVGDQVLAKTTHEVKSEARVIVPKGSKLVGHVTEVKAHTKDQATSELGIAFDYAVLKNGTEIPLSLGIQAIGRGQAAAPTMNMEDQSVANGTAGAAPSSGGRTSGSGGVVGGVRSTAGGAVDSVGLAAGGVENSAGAAGGAVSGSLNANNRGVVGLPGLTLSTETSTSANASVISSDRGNVHLDSGTEMVLLVK